MSVRFVVPSPEALIEQARVAEPPVQDGDLAELQTPKRNVLLQSSVVDFEVVWTEITQSTLI